LEGTAKAILRKRAKHCIEEVEEPTPLGFDCVHDTCTAQTDEDPDFEPSDNESDRSSENEK
jgi:hypothetical protein